MRDDLRALTPASLTALANAGLVKRAQKEIAAGAGPKIAEDAAGTVTGTFPDGIVATLPPGVPLHGATCTCGAATLCRHRIAVALAYADREASNTGAAAWSPGEVTDEELLAHVGKNALARARALRRRGLVAELTGGATPAAKLPTSTVRFHVARELAYARCDCQLASACEHVAVAVWAFREARKLPATIALGSDGPEEVAPEAIALAEHVLEQGIAHVGPAAQARFAEARAALEGQVWPAALVDDLERLVEAYRSRSARYRTGEAAFALASLWARARASGELPARFVLGSDEAKDTALDHVRLVALGARIVADDAGRRASVYLAEPASGHVLVAARTYAEEGDLSRRVVAGRILLGALAHGQLVTRAARRQANGALTLAAARNAPVSVQPLAADAWDELPVVRDRAALSRELAARPPRVLRPVRLADSTRVLALGKVVDLAYRTAEQELSARVTLAGGGDIRIERRHTRAAPHALDVLAATLREGPRYVAGDIAIGTGGLALDPSALVTDRVVVPDLEPSAHTLDGLPATEAEAPSPLAAACARATDVLEEALHDGLAHLRQGFGERAAAATAALAATGLEGARARLAAFAEARTPSSWLDAALRVELTREALLAAGHA